MSRLRERAEHREGAWSAAVSSRELVKARGLRLVLRQPLALAAPPFWRGVLPACVKDLLLS